MTEEDLLDKALEILEESGAAESYRFILANKACAGAHSSQLYNFLYCLGAAIGAKDESLKWMKEAIIGKGYWYRPEVFEDGDLDSVRAEAAFSECKKISDARYNAALKNAAALCTWK